MDRLLQPITVGATGLVAFVLALAWETGWLGPPRPPAQRLPEGVYGASQEFEIIVTELDRGLGLGATHLVMLLGALLVLGAIGWAVARRRASPAPSPAGR